MPVTIVSTELEVYKGLNPTGTAAFQTTQQGSPASILVGNAQMGGTNALLPGNQYCARARCTNSESYTTDWCTPRTFKTLPSIAFPETGGSVDLNIVQVNGVWTLMLGDFTEEDDGTHDGTGAGTICWDANVMSIARVFVSIADTGSQNPGGESLHVTTFYTDLQGIGQGYAITETTMTSHGAQFNFEGNHTYYVWLGVTDDIQDASRTYWTPAQTVSTAVAQPVIAITNPTHTFDSVGATVNVTTTETITSIVATLTPTGGGATYTKTLSTSSPQTVVFQNGQTDSQGTTMQIDPNTTYRLTIEVVTPQHASTTASTTITTDPQAVSTLAITSVTNVTPSAATVNLTYGSGS